MFSSLVDGFGSLLAFFYSLIPNYGVSIILITIASRLLLYPLTSRQARSMAKMQQVQPEIKKIQEKYKHDRQKLNEEMMAFYKEHQINPLAGCLPMIFQLPIFFALFQVLRSPAKHIPLGSDLFEAFCGPIEVAKDCAPKGLSFLTMDLSKSAPNAGSFVDALPVFLVIGLVIASGYYQSHQMTRLQKGRATPQAQMMTRVFPAMIGVISYTLPAGMVLYFFLSNLWQIGQQAIVFGRQPERAAAGGKAGPRPEGKKSPAPPAKPERTAPRPEPAPADEASPDSDGSDGDGDDRPQPEPEPEPSPAPRAVAGAPTPRTRPNRSTARKKKKRKRRR